MRLAIALCCIAVLLLAKSSLADDASAEDRKKLQGKWVPVRQEEGGKVQKESDWIQKRWEFKGDKALITLQGIGGMADAVMNLNLEIDPTAKPAKMDLIGANPKLGFIAIYKFDGDNLIVCWGPGRETRPEKFETTRSDSFWLITFKRMK